MLCAVCLQRPGVVLIEVEGAGREYLPACDACSERVGDRIPAACAAAYVGGTGDELLEGR